MHGLHPVNGDRAVENEQPHDMTCWSLSPATYTRNNTITWQDITQKHLSNCRLELRKGRAFPSYCLQKRTAAPLKRGLYAFSGSFEVARKGGSCCSNVTYIPNTATVLCILHNTTERLPWVSTNGYLGNDWSWKHFHERAFVRTSQDVDLKRRQTVRLRLRAGSIRL